MAQEMYRQGDLLFRVIPELPEGLIVRSGQVIVRGEATGHSHCLLEGRVLENPQGAVFLEAARTTQVLHQEHHALTLPTGCYRVIRQREYTPQEIREVTD